MELLADVFISSTGLHSPIHQSINPSIHLCVLETCASVPLCILSLLYPVHTFMQPGLYIPQQTLHDPFAHREAWINTELQQDSPPLWLDEPLVDTGEGIHSKHSPTPTCWLWRKQNGVEKRAN